MGNRYGVKERAGVSITELDQHTFLVEHENGNYAVVRQSVNSKGFHEIGVRIWTCVADGRVLHHVTQDWTWDAINTAQHTVTHTSIREDSRIGRGTAPVEKDDQPVRPSLGRIALVSLAKACLVGSAFLALATTFPAHPAQAAAVKTLPVCASMCFNRTAPLDLSQVEDSRDDEVVCDAELKHCTTEKP